MTPSSQAPERRAVVPLSKPPDSVIMVPGSKSITNRALVCASLATGPSTLEGPLFADDTLAMIDCLSRLGAVIEPGGNSTSISVEGTAGRLRPGPLSLDARLSGTTSRFVLPMLVLGTGSYRLDGGEPLRARPMADGIDVARLLGAEIVEEAEAGHLPLRITPASAPRSRLRLRGDISSQFLSGALMVAPCLGDGLTIEVDGPLVSRSYVEMTSAVMRSFGSDVWASGSDRFEVAPGGYRATHHVIEPDASAASYFFAAAAICGGRVRVNGLTASSMQGDMKFVEILELMGAQVTRGESFTEVIGTGSLDGIEVDMGDLSDTAQTLAVTAAFADGPTRINGIGFIRRKETDRIRSTVTELLRCGVEARETDDGIEIDPGPPHGALVRTYDDHRMAMSFSLMGLRVPGIEIDDPGCVAKTFPTFFEVLDELRNHDARK